MPPDPVGRRGACGAGLRVLAPCAPRAAEPRCGPMPAGRCSRAARAVLLRCPRTPSAGVAAAASV